MVVSNPAISTTIGNPVGFWASELAHPFHAFSEVGYEVTIASPMGGKVEMDDISDPRHPSGFSGSDLVSMGYVNTPECMERLNMIAPLVVTQAFAPLLGTDKKRQGPAGRIVNISSSVAKVAIPLLGAYSASKFSLEGMSDALRRELMLFGIDVVIIEPGTVNTAIYDKGEKEDLSEFKPTEYWEALQKLQKFVVTEARTNGLSPERLGEAVHVALSTAKPKVRYAVVPQRFKNWTLPRLLPVRMLDGQLAKMIGLIKL